MTWYNYVYKFMYRMITDIGPSLFWGSALFLRQRGSIRTVIQALQQS